jgi:DNA helicase-2/ATP-dependent DNA helicase PcrA
MTGGASLWRATTGAHDDPFAHVHRDGRGPGWERAASTGVRRPTTIDARPLAVTVGGRPRGDVAIGARVTHARFGGGTVTAIEGNKLAIDFDEAGQKMVLDSFVTVD